ncbi:hypothetical protein Ddc_19891 [Ditylenchus destructor]|nr:hypothetical protein Ddc_19891 [Ditylenchus destructor]
MAHIQFSVDVFRRGRLGRADLIFPSTFSVDGKRRHCTHSTVDGKRRRFPSSVDVFRRRFPSALCAPQNGKNANVFRRGSTENVALCA